MRQQYWYTFQWVRGFTELQAGLWRIKIACYVYNVKLIQSFAMYKKIFAATIGTDNPYRNQK